MDSPIARERIGLRALTIGMGVFFIAMSLNKVAWLTNPHLLLDRFVKWAPTASSSVRWYLEHVAIPAAPLLARLIPIGEFCVGTAFILGIWVRSAALLALFLVINFHFGTSAFYAWEFLRDGTGPPVLAALAALALGGTTLPYAARLERPVAPGSRAPKYLD